MKDATIEIIAEQLYRWQSYINRKDGWEALCEDNPSVAATYRLRARHVISLVQSNEQT